MKIRHAAVWGLQLIVTFALIDGFFAAGLAWTTGARLKDIGWTFLLAAPALLMRPTVNRNDLFGRDAAAIYGALVIAPAELALVLVVPIVMLTRKLMRNYRAETTLPRADVSISDK